jgi:hypothetical protein
MPIRLKVVRRQEEQVRKVKELKEMFRVPNSNSFYHQYQPIGASSFGSYFQTATIDPKIQKTKDLFEIFHLVR